MMFPAFHEAMVEKIGACVFQNTHTGFQKLPEAVMVNCKRNALKAWPQKRTFTAGDS